MKPHNNREQNFGFNKYQALEGFTSQYTMEFSPSDGHWFGLEFCYESQDYRLHTEIMRKDDPERDFKGREILFRSYAMNLQAKEGKQFTCFASFASMDELLCYTRIGNRPFRKVIIDKSTQIFRQNLAQQYQNFPIHGKLISSTGFRDRISLEACALTSVLFSSCFRRNTSSISTLDFFHHLLNSDAWKCLPWSGNPCGPVSSSQSAAPLRSRTAASRNCAGNNAGLAAASVV